MNQRKKILVVGATGGSGRATVQRLLAQGHQVTAFSRHAERLSGQSPRLSTINGDATHAEKVAHAVRGHDAVIITLGISENPLRVRALGPKGTALNIRSLGTENVIKSMHEHGIGRLVVQSSYGVGDTRDRLKFIDRLFFRILLGPQIADTETQEQIVRESKLDWTLAQPVHLTNTKQEVPPFTSNSGEVRRWKVSRQQVAHFMAQSVESGSHIGSSVALSG